MTSAADTSSEPSPSSSPQRTHLQTLEPSPPSPDSTREEVETYLTTYFRYSEQFTKEAALEKVKQLPVNGHALYRQNSAKLRAVFGPTGGALYDDIHTPNYGMVRLTLTPLSVIFAEHCT